MVKNATFVVMGLFVGFITGVACGHMIFWIAVGMAAALMLHRILPEESEDAALWAETISSCGRWIVPLVAALNRVSIIVHLPPAPPTMNRLALPCR